MTDAALDSRNALLMSASELGLDLDEHAVRRLLGFLALLQRWNAVYNLTAVRDPVQMLTQHVVDCLAVIGPLQRQIRQSEARVLDVGSGAGLPGVVLAIVRPEWRVHCVDAVGKKVAFLRQVAVDLTLTNLHGEQGRVEQLSIGLFDVIASRAFASLPEFISLTRRHLAPTGIWMAMKGKRPDAELALLPPNIDVFHVEQVRVPELNAERCLVWMRSRNSAATASSP